jgi:hypothetical protein
VIAAGDIGARIDVCITNERVFGIIMIAVVTDADRFILAVCQTLTVIAAGDIGARIDVCITNERVFFVIVIANVTHTDGRDG